MTLAAHCKCGNKAYFCDGSDGCPNLKTEYTIDTSMSRIFDTDFDPTVLKLLRELSQKTLKAVEIETGISNPYISQVENGHIKKPSFDSIRKLLKCYGYEIVIQPQPIEINN